MAYKYVATGRPAPYRFLSCGAALLLLAGCNSLWPFGEQTDYSIAGPVTENTELNDYLNTILEDRLEQEIEDTDDPVEYARSETFREETIQADLVKALHARGYYEGTVEYQDAEKSLAGTYVATPGPRYTIKSISINSTHEIATPPALSPGDPLDAIDVLAVQAAIQKNLQADNCFYHIDIRNAVTLNEAENNGALTFIVTTGSEATLGPVTFTGAENIKNSYLQKLVPWQEGDCFRREKIEELRTTLLESGLFSRADAILPDSPGPDGRVPVTITLSERAPRSISAGASYYTDEGIGVNFGWEHRNFLGAAETVDARLNLNQLQQELRADFRKPFFLRKDQSLRLNAALSREDNDAYEQWGLETGGFIDRALNDELSVTVGTRFQLLQIDEQNDREGTYALLSTPLRFEYDSRDNPLDPTQGLYLRGAAEPFFDMLGEGDPFFKLEGGARTYWALNEERDLILALRGRVGSILGSGTFNIPASERFYAGGGGSVRGFGYQEIGPHENDEPVGGRSLVTGSAEMRFKIAGDFGGAVFVDAGSVSAASVPDFDDLAIGTGVGIRYQTGFGPIRFDIATPVNNRDHVERNYQFYVSIGQAF